jgi:mono/diheme cytochrome c family protein
MRNFIAVILSTTVLGGVPAVARAQHATAFDVEDGARSFASYCAACHGPDGNLIPGIDLGHGQFRRPLTDDELVSIITNGIPNTAMPATPRLSDDGIRRVVAYLRANAESQAQSVGAGGGPV